MEYFCGHGKINVDVTGLYGIQRKWWL